MWCNHYHAGCSNAAVLLSLNLVCMACWPSPCARRSDFSSTDRAVRGITSVSERCSDCLHLVNCRHLFKLEIGTLNEHKLEHKDKVSQDGLVIV